MEAKICQFLHQWFFSTRPLQNSSTIGPNFSYHLISISVLFRVSESFSPFLAPFCCVSLGVMEFVHHLDQQKSDTGVHLDHFHMTHPRGQLYRSFTTTFPTEGRHGQKSLYWRWSSSHPTFNRNPYSGYINPYYWVDDHPQLYGNSGSLDPSTYHSWKKPLPTNPWDSNHH